MFKAIKGWADEKICYLDVKEDIKSIEPARQHLSLISALTTSFVGKMEVAIPAVYKLGIDIQGAKYVTMYSQWEYEKLREIKAMSETVASLCSNIRKKSEHKKAVLEDDLVREIYKERTRLMVQVLGGRPC